MWVSSSFFTAGCKLFLLKDVGLKIIKILAGIPAGYSCWLDHRNLPFLYNYRYTVFMHSLTTFIPVKCLYLLLIV